MTNFCRRLADSESFQSFILFLIIITAISMGLETIPTLMDNFGWLFDGLFIISQAVFAFEISVRLLAFAPRFRAFFDDFWNTFDFVIIVASFLPGIGSFAIIARLLRVLRVLRVLSVSDRIRGFMDRISDSLDEAIFAAIVLSVLGYIFTISGHYLFYEADPQRWGDLGSSALSIFYLLLMQDVPSYVAPVLEFSKLGIFFFLAFYFVLFAMLLGVLNAAVSQSVSNNGKKE